MSSSDDIKIYVYIEADLISNSGKLFYDVAALCECGEGLGCETVTSKLQAKFAMGVEGSTNNHWAYFNHLKEDHDVGQFQLVWVDSPGAHQGVLQAIKLNHQQLIEGEVS